IAHWKEKRTAASALSSFEDQADELFRRGKETGRARDQQGPSSEKPNREASRETAQPTSQTQECHCHAHAKTCHARERPRIARSPGGWRRPPGVIGQNSAWITD